MCGGYGKIEETPVTKSVKPKKPAKKTTKKTVKKTTKKTTKKPAVSGVDQFNSTDLGDLLDSIFAPVSGVKSSKTAKRSRRAA